MKTPQELIDCYLDDTLNDDEADELRRWLASDRNHQREFVLAVHQHRILRTASVASQKNAIDVAGIERVDERRETVESAATKRGGSGLAAGGFRRFAISRWIANWRRGIRFAALAVCLVTAWHWFNRSTTWTPPVLSDITNGAQVVVEDGRLTQRLSRRWRSSRVTVLRRVAQWLQASDTEWHLRPGDTIKLSPGLFGGPPPGSAAGETVRASVALTYPNDATTIRLKDTAILRLLSPRGGKRFELLAGVLDIDAAPQPKGQALQILTPMSKIRITGTKLSLFASGRSTRVQVTEGQVSLESLVSGQRTDVQSGQRAVVTTNAAPALQMLRPITDHFGAGSIRREVWLNVLGRFVRDLTGNAAFRSPPDRVENVSRLEKPETGTANEDAYGARYRGYLIPPITGDYTFWVAADDTGELWLSSNERPENKRLICQANEWSVHFRNWWQSAEQESAATRLEAGKRYFIEALHKEGGGGDFFSVAWQPPGAELEVIQGNDLLSYETLTSAKP